MTGSTYRYAGESESMRLAREPSALVNGEVITKDKHVCELHYQTTASMYWDKGLLEDSEKALREHHDMLKGLIPELNHFRFQED